MNNTLCTYPKGMTACKDRKSTNYLNALRIESSKSKGTWRCYINDLMYFSKNLKDINNPYICWFTNTNYNIINDCCINIKNSKNMIIHNEFVGHLDLTYICGDICEYIYGPGSMGLKHSVENIILNEKESDWFNVLYGE